ncbi:hypothetical protein [Alkalimonas amylolytica]|uniref:Uncharacterized protein n=1 Tax=Alkalimonas amylolytica TaxID=152573 RepID=A0A1H4G5D0_ALKAM|nr:hypothetical protein [Alkalimonas amylolytica]SEB04805.1 hypothetical protein SAMN04488051_1204 [Alkalimonas amylolytica]
MKIVVAVIFLVIIVVACSAESYEGEVLYSRSDCIVKFHIDTSALSREAIQANHNAFSNFIASDAVYPVAGISFPNSSRNYYYVQFSEFCERRFEIANDMIKQFLTVQNLDIDYQVFSETICPSPKTINIQGPAWSTYETCK